MSPTTFSRIAFALFSACAVGSHAFGQDRTWNLNADGAWLNNADWDPADAPDTPGENAIISSPDGTTPVTVTVAPNVTREVGDVTILDNGANPAHTIAIPNNTFLDVHGDIQNDGVIELNSTGNFTRLRLDGSDLALTGSGVVNLGAGAFNAISNATGTNTLTNAATHTIAGGGRVGDNTIGVDNAGTIDANLAGVTMTLDPSSALNASNTGVMRATSGASLVLSGNGGGAFDNAGGVIEAVGAGSEVRLTSNARVTGGTVRGVGGGLVRAGVSENVFFTDTAFEGTFRVDNNTDFGLGGSIANDAAITIDSAGNATDVEIQTDTALQGGGSITLQGGLARINGIGNAVLTNGASHTIEGRGNIGVNTVGIVNNGLIDANSVGETLTVDPDSTSGLDNNATMRASAGGRLLLTGNASGAFDNAGGLIEAVGAGAEVQLTTNARVIGGTVRGVSGGVVRAVASQNVFFTDVTLEGEVLSDNNTDFGISGVITNNAAITINSTANNTDVELQDDTTLQGGGSITLQGPIARINSLGGPHTLTNNGNTIDGSGAIDTPIVNNGAISGTSAADFIEINRRVSGDGSLANVRIDNIHAPGNDVATVALSGDYTIANAGELHIDIGGTAVGTEYDRLSSTGDVTLDGDLVVSPIDLANGYTPAAGDEFTIITSTSPISGTFDSESLPLIYNERVLLWDPVNYSDPMEVSLRIDVSVLGGDANDDGRVDLLDLDILGSNFGTSGAGGPSIGDFDFSGTVNLLDLDILGSNFGFGTATSAAVPEPSALVLCCFCLFASKEQRDRG